MEYSYSLLKVIHIVAIKVTTAKVYYVAFVSKRLLPQSYINESPGLLIIKYKHANF